MCDNFVSVVPVGRYGHPRAEPEPAGVLPLCLLQDRLQLAGLQSLDTFTASSHYLLGSVPMCHAHIPTLSFISTSMFPVFVAILFSL